LGAKNQLDIELKHRTHGRWPASLRFVDWQCQNQPLKAFWSCYWALCSAARSGVEVETADVVRRSVAAKRTSLMLGPVDSENLQKFWPLLAAGLDGIVEWAKPNRICLEISAINLFFKGLTACFVQHVSVFVVGFRGAQRD
jgi:hypothetical protein